MCSEGTKQRKGNDDVREGTRNPVQSDDVGYLVRGACGRGRIGKVGAAMVSLIIVATMIGHGGNAGYGHAAAPHTVHSSSAHHSGASGIVHHSSSGHASSGHASSGHASGHANSNGQAAAPRWVAKQTKQGIVYQLQGAGIAYTSPPVGGLGKIGTTSSLPASQPWYNVYVDGRRTTEVQLGPVTDYDLSTLARKGRGCRVVVADDQGNIIREYRK